jgi:hypothetical protein
VSGRRRKTAAARSIAAAISCIVVAFMGVSDVALRPIVDMSARAAKGRGLTRRLDLTIGQSMQTRGQDGGKRSTAKYTHRCACTKQTKQNAPAGEILLTRAPRRLIGP